jgi:TonB family protein
MKLSSTIAVAALLLGSLASVAQQPTPALTGDAKPDTGSIAADVYTNQFFGFSYRVPAQWTGKAIQRSQPGQRFYQLLSALPATSGASIQYMGIQAEDITAPVVKTASQFIQSSPLAGKNSAYEMLGPVREMEIGGHHFARADYKTKPSADDAGLTMYQTQLVTVLHNHAVTLSFTSDSQPAIDQLVASASSMIFLSAPAAAPIPAAPAPQPVVTTPAVAVATPAPAPAKPRAAPEVTNGTVVMTFSDDPAPAKTTTQVAAAPEAQTPAPEPTKSEPVAVQTTVQPVTFNPKPEPKVETVAATAPAKSKPSAGIPVNNILANNPEPVTVAKNDPPVLNTPAPTAAPVTTTAETSTPVTVAPETSTSPAPPNSAATSTAAAEVVSDATPTSTVAVSGITRVSDTRMRLSEEALKEYIFSKSPMVYPQLAKQMNVQGSVVMQIVISMEGKVKEVKVLSGAPQLQGTAVDSLRNWRFLPYLDNGRPMEVESQVTIGFKLSGR